MIELLARIFIKERGEGSPEARRAYGVLSGAVGIFLNVLLFAGKLFVGTLTGSIAVSADAFNNLSDAGSSLITMAGFRLAGKKPDREHPYGHGRIEYISGLIVSMAIVLMGFELAKSSIGGIIHPEPVELSPVALIILIASILVKLYIAFYNRRLGKRFDSGAMLATSTDSLCDMISTAAVLVSLLVSRFAGLNIDGWVGLLVALFILYSGVTSAKEMVETLLGTPPSEELVSSIESIVMAHKPVALGIHDLTVHDYGPGRLMISLHVEVPGDMDIFAAHDEIDNIEAELNEKLRCEATIHMDPLDTHDPRIDSLRSLAAAKAAAVDSRVTIHDLRIVTGTTHTNLVFDAVIPHDVPLTDAEIRAAITDGIREEYPTFNCVIKIDRPYC